MPVGAAGVCALSEEELEAHIGDCARLMEQAVYTGNRVEAEQYRRDMYAAIGMRSPEQIRRMEIERGLADPCYFLEQGARDAQAGQGRRAA
jgi:hypothetical protein